MLVGHVRTFRTARADDFHHGNIAVSRHVQVCPAVNPQSDLQREVRAEENPPVSAERQAWNVSWDERMQEVRRLNMKEHERSLSPIFSVNPHQSSRASGARTTQSEKRTCRNRTMAIDFYSFLP